MSTFVLMLLILMCIAGAGFFGDDVRSYVKKRLVSRKTEVHEEEETLSTGGTE